MQRSEQHQITINRYRDRDGNPTCAKDFEAGEVCLFYGTYSSGCRETCWLLSKGVPLPTIRQNQTDVAKWR